MTASSLVEAGLAAVIVNPGQVRNFAKATGILAKTDAIDARVIDHFAEAVKPEVRPLKDRATSELAAIRCNPAIKGFYQRLLAAGKCHKVAATACTQIKDNL